MDFVPPLVAVVVGAGVLALKVLLQSGRRAEDALADETWASAARRVGGVVHITPGSLFTSASRTIEVTVEGIREVGAVTRLPIGEDACLPGWAGDDMMRSRRSSRVPGFYLLPDARQVYNRIREIQQKSRQ